MATEPATVAKDRFTALDTLAVVRELRAIGRAFVDKSFDLPHGGVAIELRSPTAGRRELRIVPGRYAALLPERATHAEEPGPIARELRRLLLGGSLADIPDPSGERYLEIVVRRGDAPEPLTLAVELFGTGNLLVARGSRLVAVAHPKTWAHRTVRVGAEYQKPPSRGSPWSRSEAELASMLGQSRTDRASTLAARMGLGGPIAEEVLARAGLEGLVPAPTDATTAASSVHKALAELLVEVGDGPRGYLYFRGETPVDVEPFPSVRWRSDPTIRLEEVPSFSEAAERYFVSVLPSEKLATPDRRAELRAEFERQRERQSAAVEEMAAQAAELTALADAIYAHYTDLEAQRAAAERAGESGTVTLSAGGRNVPVIVAEPLDRSARALYEQAKELQRKLRGARDALAESVRRLESEAALPPVEPVPSVPAAAKPLWFERFRWFVSSEGFLCVGGRDAASNELLVRRYLRPRDRYVHADVHGAPSVVVKHPEGGNAEPSDATMREAGQLSVAFSKAWRAGLAAGSAFWVLPEQVSKSGASGEFVARGAFVIHGTKNAIPDLPTELAVGTVSVQGRELLCAGPPQALRSRGAVRFLLAPGEERDRPGVEVELARSLGVSRSRLQSLLPAGGVTVRPA